MTCDAKSIAMDFVPRINDAGVMTVGNKTGGDIEAEEPNSRPKLKKS